MSDWQLFRGDGEVRKTKFPDAPPWRRFNGEVVDDRYIKRPDGPAPNFQATAPLIDAVNAALYLRRPLLLTGQPGSGKSSLIEMVAYELNLGAVLRWHVTSHSTLERAVYRYDALGRLQDHQLGNSKPDIGNYLDLGPLGTALLPTNRPRALLIDEIDKSDIDLPNDLLHVFERGEYEIPELARLKEDTVHVRAHEEDTRFIVKKGKLVCREFPFVVLTSNGERDFPAAFLRRCVRFTMSAPDEVLLGRIVEAHLGAETAIAAKEIISDFAKRAEQSSSLATDQLLNAIFMVTNRAGVNSEDRETLKKLLLKELRSDRA